MAGGVSRRGDTQVWRQSDLADSGDGSVCLSPQQWGDGQTQKDQEFKAIFGYRTSLRPAWATEDHGQLWAVAA